MDMTDIRWTGSTQAWKQVQQAVRQRLCVQPIVPLPRFVGACDCAFSRDGNRIQASAVVYDRIEHRLIEQTTIIQDCEVPYIPTFLSFREIPALLAVLQKLKHSYSALLVDGQGIAHPRRCGIATHLGVLLDIPTIGCAKSRLIGDYVEPGPRKGDYSKLKESSETIGLVLRTRERVKPVFVSVGHRSDLSSCRALVMACCTRYRLPEPLRQADRLSKVGLHDVGTCATIENEV